MDTITKSEADKINEELAEVEVVHVGGFQIGVSTDRQNLIFRFTSRCPKCEAGGQEHELKSEFMRMDLETAADFNEAMRLCLKSVTQ